MIHGKGMTTTSGVLARWIRAATVLGSLGLAATAFADVRSDARRVFGEGMDLVRAGKFDVGIAKLEEAYALLPHPAVLYNIARAQLDAEALKDAVFTFERYLQWDPDDREAVLALVTEVRERIAIAQASKPAPLPQGSDDFARQPQGAGEPGNSGRRRATKKELAVLNSAAAQLQALAEATQSENLAIRSRELRTLAKAFRQRRPRSASRDPAAAEEPPSRRGPSAKKLPAAGPGNKAQAPAEAAANAVKTPELETRVDDVYEEEVVSASLYSRSPLNAPNSTTIVTAQDIRLSGVTSLAELLRRAAGVEVMTLTPGDAAVSIRGLNQRMSNKVLVLVNGRSIYLDFLGATLWQLMPVAINDIERIEIIRGPASALYGADAVTGVVNVILKAPGHAGSQVSMGVGTGGALQGTASFSGRRKDGLGYHLAGGYEQTNHYSLVVDPARQDIVAYSDSPNRALQKAFFSVDLQQRLAADFTAAAGARLSDGRLAFQGISRLRELFLSDALFAQSHLELDLPQGFSVKTFWNYLACDVGSAQVVPGAIPVTDEDLRTQVVDVETSYSRSFALLLEHEFAVGVAYRWKRVEWDWLDDKHAENHFSVFLEDTMSIGEVARIALSSRVDRHPLLKQLQLSPRASVVIRPSEDSAVRFVVGSAFRSPTFLESYLNFPNPMSLRAVTSFGRGNRKLNPERLFSAELGFARNVRGLLAFEGNGYYNLVDDQILLTKIVRDRLADPAEFVDEVSAFSGGAVQFENENARFKQLGVDLGVRLFPVQGLDLYVNYALHDTSPANANADLAGREADRRTSRHKVNMGVQFRSLFGLDVALDLHWVSDQVWVEQVSDATAGARFEAFEVPSYLLVNGRVGYRLLDDKLELALAGTNLLNQGHRQHPFGQRVDRRVLVTTAARF